MQVNEYNQHRTATLSEMQTERSHNSFDRQFWQDAIDDYFMTGRRVSFGDYDSWCSEYQRKWEQHINDHEQFERKETK